MKFNLAYLTFLSFTPIKPNPISGFDPKFIDKKLPVAFPKLSPSQKADLAPCADNPSGEYKYVHHSLFLSKSRRFPFFTATNINAALFQKIKRDEVFNGTDVWQIDSRGKEYQFGQHLYDAQNSDFQRGHMTKREDPQWGDTPAQAIEAAQSTFYFANCVPQVAELNTKKWAHLETYILEKQSVPNKMMVTVFTGPVLANHDPIFVSKVDGNEVQIPVLFWKVVYYTNDGKTLNKVGFLMGQEELLDKKGIVRKLTTGKTFEIHAVPTEHFLDFEDAETYQVSLNTIEKLSGLKFSKANEPNKDPRPIKLILQQVEMKNMPGKSMKKVSDENAHLHYQGIVL